MAPEYTDSATTDQDSSAEFLWAGSNDFDFDGKDSETKSLMTGTDTGTEKTFDGTVTNTAPRQQPTERKTDESQPTQTNPKGQSTQTTSDSNTTSTSRDEATTLDHYPHPTNTSPGDQEPNDPNPKPNNPTTQSSATTKENPTATTYTRSKPSDPTKTSTYDSPKNTSVKTGGSSSVDEKEGGGGGGMPTKTKVAIAVPVAVVGALIIAALIYFFLRRRNRQKRNKAVPSADHLVMSTAASTPAHTQPYPPPFPSPQPHSPASFAAVPAEPSPHHSNPNINIEPPAAVATRGDSPNRPTSQLPPTDHPAILVPGADQQQHQQQPERQPYHSSGDPIAERNLWHNAAATTEPRPRSPFDHPMDDQLSVMSAMSERRAHPHDRDDASSVSSVSDDEAEERVRPR